MALMKSKEVPKDAVVMNETEATTYVWDMVSDWTTLSDTWALRYGPTVLGGINSISGIIINKHYRDKLKLGSYGYMSSVIPIAVLPGLLTALFHRHMVSTELLLMKGDACPICYEIRALAIQSTLGVVYPMILAPTSALMFANRYATYRVPSLIERKNFYQFVKKITRPLSGTLTFITTIQFVSACAITYFEMRNNFAMRKKIVEIEKKIIAEHGSD